MSREKELNSARYEGSAPEIVIQAMPVSPGITAMSPEEGTFVSGSGDYFSQPVRTTSAPLPAKADLVLGLPEDLVSGLHSEDTAVSTPLTSISSSTFFVDSSASAPHTTDYSGSPGNSSNRPTSQSGHTAHSSPRLNLPLPTPWPPHGTSQTMPNFAPSLTQGISVGHGLVPLPETLNEARSPGSSRHSVLSLSPSQLPTAALFGVQGSFLATSIARDALLAYIHRLYNDSTNAPRLIPLLESIRSQHPQHLPTLLLLSCIQYSAGDYDACLSTCNLILSIDPNYVEAMSNLGMAMRAKGRNKDAETWWLKAIRLRPTYWDAIDNLLHVLCENGNLSAGVTVNPRYQDALQVLNYVLNTLIRSDGLLLVLIPPIHLHRLQNLLYTSGNLRSVVTRSSRAGIHDYNRALELAFRHPVAMDTGDQIRFHDVIIATVVIGLLATTPPHLNILNATASALGVDPGRFTNRMLEQSIDWLSLVHRAGKALVDVLLREGKGVLPMILLTPEKASRIPEVLFGVYARNLPALCVRASYEDSWSPAPGVDVSAMNKVTSNVLLTLARLLLHNQDLRDFTDLLDPTRHIPPSQSLVAALYYLAVSLNPTPSTYNNMGILFFSIEQSASLINAEGQPEAINGVTLAQMYYKRGLAMDPYHPHLLTNYGSLLKDQGHPLEAINMYEQALKVKPDFDVALVNLANVIKDNGRLADAVAYYKRALAVSPDSSDAICGLANAMSSICDWRGSRGSIGNEPVIDEQTRYHVRSDTTDTTPHGWMGLLETVTKKQLQDAYLGAVGVFGSSGPLEQWHKTFQNAYGVTLDTAPMRYWKPVLSRFYTEFNREEELVNETGFIIRLIELLNRIVQKRWYHDLYGENNSSLRSEGPRSAYHRLGIPANLKPPPVPSVLPFHTFTYTLDARVLRLVAHRNALRISFQALTASWLPETVFRPSAPLGGKINIGYVSSDLNNHPLAHLMLSTFSLHDRQKFNIFVYATTSSDNSYYRQRIEQDAQIFRDVSTSPAQEVVEQITEDKIHVLVNLGGYTKAARNDIFAARPCPVQMSFLGYAATSGAGWCDYVIGDVHACPKEAFEPYYSAMRRRAGHRTSRMADYFKEMDLNSPKPEDESDPESLSMEWSFTERFLHMPHSYFVTDHRQAFRESHFDPRLPQETIWLHEERLRFQLRKDNFPDLPDDAMIFACFSQLYKLCPSAFYTWLKILQRVPKSILWLLRFPSAGEEHLLRTAMSWAGPEVASRVRFTDVVRKEDHIRRCRVADLFLDTFQCNAHTIAADVLWTGTPILTWPKERLKMCTRVASSIAYATGFGDQMVVGDIHSYENRAVSLARSVSHRMEPNPEGGFDRRGSGELMELRRNIFLHRDKMPLFDTKRWVRNLERGYQEVWGSWVRSCQPPWTDDEDGGCITLTDNDPFFAT